jgi:DNA-binding transcriptional MerR regulator
MYTPKQVAERANVHSNSIRNWSDDYAEFLSPEARGETGARLYTDEDVDTLCTVAALRRTGLKQSQVADRLRAAAVPPVVDVATSQPPETLQTAYNSLQAPLAVTSIQHAPYNALQRQVDTLERRVETLVRAAVLWGVLLGAIAALVLGGFALWALYLFGG